MSSEMMELVVKWRGEVLPLPDINDPLSATARAMAKSYNCALTACADELEALLARTEAGADGVDTFAEWLATEMPAGTVIGNPAWWANRIARQYRVRSGVTHPQDASGDAGFSAAELESLAKCVLASVTPGGFHIPEGWNVLLDKLTAMQAKEAK